MKYQYLALVFFSSIGVIPYQISAQRSIENDSPCQPCKENNENGWCWGTDVKTAKEKNVLYNDALSIKDYEATIEHLEWLLTNTPNLNKAIYINGVKIYNKLAKVEKDPEKKKQYRQRELDLYDKRIACYGDEANVLQRKGTIAYSYLSKDSDKKKMLFDLYYRIMELNGNETKHYNLTYLMVTNVNAKINKLITEKEALEVYDKITEILDYNIANAKGEEKKKWEERQSKIDGFLLKIVPKMTCEFIQDRMGEDIKNKKEDIKIQKRTLKYLLTAKCFDHPLFLEVSQNIFAVEPALGLAKTISSQYIKLDNIAKAIEWKEKALNLVEEDPQTKSQLHLDIAVLLIKQNDKINARKRALKSVKIDASLASKVYTFIGNLYMTSGKECNDPNPVKSRTIYLAAYDMFQKAGDKSSMQRAKEQFPSIENIFTQNLKEGDQIDVICWIGGKTTIRRR